MSIFVIGINHKTAPIEVREKMYFARDQLSLYLQDILARGAAREAVLLSTCNRSELYCEADHIETVQNWFCAQAALPREQLIPLLYVYQDEAAVAHITEVACGLDSMVLGEPQILGQMKEAFSESCTAVTISTLFHRLFQSIFAIAKEIRTATAIGACPVSVASAAVRFAKEKFGVDGFREARIALIGAGDMTELLLRYLQQENNHPLTLINRSFKKATALLQSPANVYSLNQLSRALQNIDVVFSATGSTIPIVTQTMMNDVMNARGAKPLMLIDIAVPRDIEPAVGELNQVDLYCIDDLKMIIEKNRQGREHAADKARAMIKKKSGEFITQWQSIDKVTHTIRAYRNQVEEICYAELIKAKQQLHQGADPLEVLDAFANAFTKKLLHVPSVQLRQAGEEGRLELLRYAKQLFAIPDADIERM